MQTEAERQAAGLESFVEVGRHRGELYGVGWGDPDQVLALRRVRDDFLLANLRPGMTALEIGSGGGRWSRYFAGRVARAILVDATPASEAAIRERSDWLGFAFLLSPDGHLSSVPDASVDFVFSFDTFVHFDRELFNHYVGEVGRVLKPGGRFVLHYAHRWPGCEQNDVCFKYREPVEVEALLAGADFRLTGRQFELRGGYGSLLVEAVRTDYKRHLA